MTTSFFIEKKNKSTRLYLKYDHNSLRTMFSTKVSVSEDQLNWITRRGHKQIDNALPLNKKYPSHHRVNKDLIAEYNKIIDIVYRTKETGGDLDPKNIKRIYEQRTNQSDVKTIIQGIDLIISKYKNELSVAALKNYDNNLRHNIINYNQYKKKRHKLIDLNKYFELDFKNYLTDQRKAKSTIDNQVKYLKSLCAKLKELDIEVHPAVFTFKRSKSNKSIFYLSEIELDRLRVSIPKSKSLLEQKDVFVLQCYTGLRVSDLRRVNLDTISEDRSMIVMRATKTDEAIKLPILPEAEEILSKYDYKLPFISNQKYNKAIKDFLKELDFDRKIESQDFAPLYEVCTSHIARKTFLSYLINVKKLSAPEVKEITGTSADTIYKHYAGADVAEIAKKMRG
jgi:integrase